MHFVHRIRRQKVELVLEDEAQALALQPRLGEINRRRFLAVIESVFDEFDVPGQVLRIDRLDLDLGILELEGLERVAIERLEGELRRTLSDRLASLATQGTAGERWREERVARLELLEHFLRFGTLPYGAPSLTTFSFENLFRSVVEEDGQGLTKILRHHGHRTHVLERLVFLLGEGMRHNLLHLLLPEHAELITTYLLNVREVHRSRPLVSLGDEALARVLWFLTLTFLLREPGTQFNRRSYLRSLLRSLARREGVEYHDLLSTLRRGLEEIRRFRSIVSSLPQVLEELTGELPKGTAREPFSKIGGSLEEEAWPEAEHLADAAMEEALESMSPEAVAAVRRLMEALRSVPSPYRVRAEVVGEVVLAEVLRPPRGEVPGRAFLIRVLHRLYGATPAHRVLASMRQQLKGWSSSGALPAARLEAFDAALREVEGEERVLERRRGEGGEAVRQIGGRNRLRAAVWTELLGFESSAFRDERNGPVDATTFSNAALRAELERWLEESPEELEPSLRRYAGDRRWRERWLKKLGERALERLGQVLMPRRHRTLLEAAETLAAAWFEVAPRNQPGLVERSIFWHFILQHFARRPSADHSVKNLVTAFSAHLAELYPQAPAATDRPDAGTQWLERAAHLARDGGRSSLAAELERRRTDLLVPWQAAAPQPSTESPKAVIQERNTEKKKRPTSTLPTAFGFLQQGEGEEPEGALYIANAGLVLVGPFLPNFFEALDLLERDDEGAVRMRDREALSRGVHLLQYLVNGRTDTEEPLLALNKLLCGASTSVPVAAGIEPRDEDLALCDKLLHSMIANWKIIENTSISGLQQTFLQREGRLHHTPEGWRLLVDRKTLDVLVDQVPWSLSVVLHRWMSEPVYVTW